MERYNSKAQTSGEQQRVQSAEAQHFEPVDHFTHVEVELSNLLELHNQHEDGIRFRIPRTACYTVICCGGQKTAAGLYDYHRQRHTELCP